MHGNGDVGCSPRKGSAIRKYPHLRKLLAYRIYQFLADRYRSRE
jgi:hypothetical protein